MEKMKTSDEVAATFWLSTKPLPQFLKGKWPEGFKFLPVAYTEELDYYAPAQLDHADYPSLIPDGQHVPTISVPAVLAVYDWSKDAERHKRLVRLVDYLFERFERLQKEPGYHERWKDVNLAGTVPGWQRFRPMQERLDRIAAAAKQGIPPPQARANAVFSAFGNAAAQERLFREFMEYLKQKDKAGRK
jgi:hypothetical protein